MNNNVLVFHEATIIRATLEKDKKAFYFECMYNETNSVSNADIGIIPISCKSGYKKFFKMFGIKITHKTASKKGNLIEKEGIKCNLIFYDGAIVAITPANVNLWVANYFEFTRGEICSLQQLKELLKEELQKEKLLQIERYNEEIKRVKEEQEELKRACFSILICNMKFNI